jgi:cytochrome bd-type quinol oxidase subunit 2
MATLLAFILSIVLAWYICKEERCSNAMKTYYLVIHTILTLLFIVVLGGALYPGVRFPSYVFIIPVLFFIIHIIMIVIHAIYAFDKSEKSIEAVLILGSLLVFLGVCVIIMGSYILNLPVSQAGNFPVIKYYTTPHTTSYNTHPSNHPSSDPVRINYGNSGYSRNHSILGHSL